MNLTDLGWNDRFQQNFEAVREDGMTPARVAREERAGYLLWSEAGEWEGVLAGRLRHEALGRGDLPAVGDWVAARPMPGEARAVIAAVLPRATCLSRKAAGARTEEQVLAANVEVFFIVAGLDEDFNPRRIERYVTLAWTAGALPVIVLNKADLCEDVAARAAEVAAVAYGLPLHPVSAASGKGVDALRAHLAAGKTAVLLGSSGVGKSTLINALLGEDRLRTNAVRESDGRGQHTTTHREMILLPGGGVVIDTPGLRELVPWSDEDAVRRTFDDIERLAHDCRFRDCRHNGEPGCAVSRAIEEGALDPGRLESFRKQEREMRYLARRQNESARQIEQARWKNIHKHIRDIYKLKRPGWDG